MCSCQEKPRLPPSTDGEPCAAALQPGRAAYPGWIIGQAWASPTLVCLMSSFVCVVRRPSVVHRSRLSWSVVSYTITATTWTYCPAPFCLLHRTSMSNSETMLVRHRQREGERTATGTQDKRAAVLRRLHVATSLSLTQCFIGYFQKGEFAPPPLPQNETLKTIVIFTVRLRTVRHSQHSMTLLLSQSSYDSKN